MPEVLLISKPIAPPWTDSNKNLVRDLAGAMSRWTPTVMTPAGSVLPGIRSEGIYPDVGLYAPSRLANARVLGRLLTGSRKDLWHFFFSPNPLTLRAGRVAAALRRVPTVHTLASAPDDLERVAGHLFADRVVALSEHTARRLRACGVDATVILPAQAPVRVEPDAVARARAEHGLPETYVLYPGDLEFSDGAATFLDAACRGGNGVGFVVASRPKTARAKEAAASLETAARARGASLVILGELRDIHAVVAGALCTCLVVNTLHAKMDLPLVLLESLLLGVPVMVGAGTPAETLGESGGAEVVPAGDGAALAARITALRDDPDRRAAMAAAGARWVQQHCAPSTVAARYEALYDALRAGRGNVAATAVPR
jgi:glycosyltransferase involved in cell wall biosynthesis